MAVGTALLGRGPAGRVARLAAVLVLTGAAAFVPRPRTAEGPPLGFTGGFGEPSCVACHLGAAVNAFGGRVVLRGLPEAFTPGTAYTLTVVLEAEETSVAGFELASRFGAGAGHGESAGTLATVDARVAIADSAGITYARQTREGSLTSSSEGSSWSLTWTAPTGDAPVTFNVAANSGNADNSPLSDLVYTTELTVPPASTDSVRRSWPRTPRRPRPLP